MILLLECLIPLLQFEKQIPHSAIEKMTTTTSVLYVPNKEARNLNYHPKHNNQGHMFKLPGFPKWYLQ
jgi:hypothetical protein